MYDETKNAVKKAFEIGEILFFMGREKYGKLLEITSAVSPPNFEELEKYAEENDVSIEDAVIIKLKEKYKSVALANGFTEQEGVAMLELAAMWSEVKDD